MANKPKPQRAPGSESPLGDMDADTFRRHGQRALDWIAEYLDHSDRYPVMARVRPGDVRAALPAAPPEQSESFDAILDDFERVIVPGLTHWNHPGFFAYFATSGSAPGVIGELLAAALNVNAMLWRTSPAATELEALTLDWLRQLVGLPDGFEGVMYDTASMSTLHALTAAREATIPNVREQGLVGRGNLASVRVYCSEQAHSSLDKAVILLGLGQTALRKIPVDAEFRMRPEVLADAVAEDRAAGRAPMAVVATVGTTTSTSVDPVPAIARICKAEQIWLHVDAAYAGVAAMVPNCAHILDGCDGADSVVINPHKWLFTQVDLSVLFSRRMDMVRAAFSLTPDYLRTAEADQVHNLMDTGIQLGRRFRALKLWMVLRHFGAEGIRQRLAEHMRLARLFASWVDAHDDFERLAPVPFSVVCFRAHPSGVGWDEAEFERFNTKLLEALNASGEVFLSQGGKLMGRYVIRLAIGNLRTTEQHVARAWELVQHHARELASR
jgi:aromatic-L-amino-acid decarboxylase